MSGPLINPSTVGSPLLSRQRISVDTDGGEIVVMTIGNVEVKLPYETALQLSQWLRVRGKEAKRRAGDMSRHWSAVGVLEDLTASRASNYRREPGGVSRHEAALQELRRSGVIIVHSTSICALGGNQLE